MKTSRVLVLPYDPQWARDFETIREELAAVLGGLALSIEHIGSTSVPGLSAKPIIDLDVVISGYEVFPQIAALLSEAGYFHEGDLGISGREAFRYEGKAHLRQHHLYVCPADSRELHRHIVFRNYLRSHPEKARLYAKAKEEAARRYPDSIEEYIRCKSPVIEELYTACGLHEKAPGR